MQNHSGESPSANLHNRIAASTTSLHFGFVELLRSARYALGLRLLSIQVFAYVPGYAIYFFLAYWSGLLSGRTLANAWAEWGLLPGFALSGHSPPLSAWVVYSLGAAALAIAFFVSNAAGSRLLWMQWRGQQDYSVREAFNFAAAKIGAVFMAPAAIIFLIVLFAGGLWLIGLAGRLPYLDELLVTIFAWLWMLAALAMLLLFAVAGLIFILAPAIVATTGEGAMTAIFQTASIFWNQPWRLLLYLATIIGVALAGLIALALLAKRAFLLMDALFAAAMGADYQNLSAQAQYLLQNWSAGAHARLSAAAPGLASQIFFPRAAAPLELTPWFNVLAHLLALSLVFSAVWVLAYPLAIINYGLASVSLLLRKPNDTEKFLERHQADEPTSP